MKKVFLFTIIGLLFSQCQNSNNNHQNQENEKTTVKKPQAESPKEVPSETKYSKPILGIDVSHFQGDVNWEEVKKAKIIFAYAKATQGETYTDPDFKRNWSDINQAGLHRGAYHFYMASDDAAKQANLFIKTVEAVDKGDMPPVLDLEQGGMPKPVSSKAEFQKGVLQWLKIVEEKLEIKPIIYTNTPFGNEYLNSPEFANYYLWLAQYEVKEPQVPQTWEKEGWLIWQRTERGKIEGAMGNVDHDIYNSDKLDFSSILDPE